MPLGRPHFRRHVSPAVLWTAGVLALSGLWAAALLRPADHVGPCTVVDGPSVLRELPEASGLAVSRRHPGLLWSHNDSGHAPVLFAVDATGSVRGRVRLPVETRDWEDVSAAPCGDGECLYVADIGDNSLVRRRVQIYRVAEPTTVDGEAGAVERFEAVYADGPHNAEAMFLVGAEVFIVTRDRDAGVYRATMAARARLLTFRRVGALGLTGVSDAETSRDGELVAVRTPREAVLYRAADLLASRFAAYLQIPLEGLREPQGEGVALDGDMLYLASEARPWSGGGMIVRLRCRFSAPSH